MVESLVSKKTRILAEVCTKLEWFTAQRCSPIGLMETSLEIGLESVAWAMVLVPGAGFLYRPRA